MVKQQTTLTAEQCQQLSQAAVQAFTANNLAQARHYAQRLLDAAPYSAAMYMLLAGIAHKQHNNALAKEQLLKAIELEPTQADFYFNLGVILVAMNNRVEAITAYEKTIALAPMHMPAYENLAPLYFGVGKIECAFATLQAAIAKQPQRASLYCHLADLYLHLDDIQASKAACDKALQINPQSAKAYRVLGSLANKQQAYQQAVDYFDQALSLQPGYPAAQWGRGLADLSLGELKRGWEGYDTIFETNPKRNVFNYLKPKWQGQPLANKTILVLPEQGLGDELLFYSCLPDLIKQAKQVRVCCDSRLQALLHYNYPACQFIGVERSQALQLTAEQLDEVDYMIALGSLPRYLRQCLADFPQPAPSLQVMPEIIQPWQHWLASLPQGIKVGLSWRSFKITSTNAKAFSILEDWTPLATLPNVVLINLQANLTAKEQASIKQRVLGDFYQPPALDMFKQLDHVAGLLTQLDYVIGSNNSMTMFAAALGCHTVMLRQREWEMLGTDYYPWFARVHAILPIKDDWLGSTTKVAVYLNSLAKD